MKDVLIPVKAGDDFKTNNFPSLIIFHTRKHSIKTVLLSQ